MKRHPILLYLALVVLISAPYNYLLLRAGSLDLARGFVIHSLMWTPALAAFMTCWRVDGSLVRLGWGWGRTRYVAAGYLIPVAYSVLAYVPLWLTGLAPPLFAGFAAHSAKGLGWEPGSIVPPLLLQVFLTMSFGVVQSSASAAGEEIGWRGFLVPALSEKYAFGGVVLISGLIWAAWHMPVVLFADYNGAAPKGYSVACFTVMILASGAIAAWLRLRSGSVWPAIVFHATHNAVVQWVFDPMTASDSHAAWYAGEFGAALAISTTVVAIVLLWRYGVPIKASMRHQQ